MVSRTVLGRKTGAVHAENHRQILKRRVVNDAVVRALQKSRVDGADGMKTHGRHAASEQDCVLFCNADVIVAVGHRFFQNFQTRSGRHGRSNADQGGILLAELNHRLAEYILPVWRRARFDRQGCSRRGIVWT